MLKWHQNLITLGRPLGTRLFRPKRRQYAPAPQIAAADGVGPGLLGEDLGGGNKNLREEESRRRMGGRIRRPRVLVSHADPEGRRIVEGCALVPPRQFIRTLNGNHVGSDTCCLSSHGSNRGHGRSSCLQTGTVPVPRLQGAGEGGG